MEKTSKIIAVTLCTVSLFLFIYIAFTHIDDFANFNFGGAKISLLLINAMMVTANALLLFSTLQYQGRSFKLERFDSNFFKLLEYFRQLIANISFEVELINEDYCIEKIRVRDGFLFKFANNEIITLEKYFSKDTYSHPLCDDYEKGIEAIEEEYSSPDKEIFQNEKKTKIVNYVNSCRLDFVTNIYRISEQEWNALKKKIVTGDLSCTDLAFTTFLNKWGYYYHPYLQSLRVVLSHIQSCTLIKRKEKNRYKEYVISQMSQDEKDFVKRYYYNNKEFKALANSISIKFNIQ